MRSPRVALLVVVLLGTGACGSARGGADAPRPEASAAVAQSREAQLAAPLSDITARQLERAQRQLVSANTGRFTMRLVSDSTSEAMINAPRADGAWSFEPARSRSATDISTPDGQSFTVKSLDAGTGSYFSFEGEDSVLGAGCWTPAPSGQPGGYQYASGVLAFLDTSVDRRGAHMSLRDVLVAVGFGKSVSTLGSEASSKNVPVGVVLDGARAEGWRASVSDVEQVMRSLPSGTARSAVLQLLAALPDGIWTTRFTGVGRAPGIAAPKRSTVVTGTHRDPCA